MKYFARHTNDKGETQIEELVDEESVELIRVQRYTKQVIIIIFLVFMNEIFNYFYNLMSFKF
jgi:hypothetical protein